MHTICDDSHLVVINAKLLDAFSSRVDQPQTVLLSRLEFEF